jgi:hypothetical protein
MFDANSSTVAHWRALDADRPDDARVSAAPNGSAWSSPVHRLPALHQEGALWAKRLAVASALCCLIGGSAALHAGPGDSGAGWLQLERDQRAYRERVAPLDLRERRDLSIIEREQRNALRATEQRLRRREQLDDRDRVASPREMPRRNGNSERRRALERQRLDLRMEQYRLPYGRRPR